MTYGGICSLVQDSCSEQHISDRKEAFRKFMNSTPPPFGTSAENPGTLDLIRSPVQGGRQQNAGWEFSDARVDSALRD